MKLAHHRRTLIVAAAVAAAAVMLPAIALAAPATGPAHPAIMAVPQCKSANIEVWLGLNPDGAAAGTTFYPIEFTNAKTGSHTCFLAGTPGVFAINSAGKRIGPALTAKSGNTDIVLKPGQTAFARIGIVDAGVIAGCTKATGAGLMVTPPGETGKQPILSFTFPACTNKKFMNISKLSAGVGIP